MSGLINKAKDALSGHKENKTHSNTHGDNTTSSGYGDNPNSTNYGSHNNNAMNKADPVLTLTETTDMTQHRPMVRLLVVMGIAGRILMGAPTLVLITRTYSIRPIQE